MSPLKRRLLKRRRATDLTPLQVGALLDGYVEGSWESFGWRYGSDPKAKERRREAWERHRQSLLPYWALGKLPPGWDLDFMIEVDGIARIRGPGTRPSVWWELEAPEPRDETDETELAYLERHNLLLPGERERYDATRPWHNWWEESDPRLEDDCA